MAGKTVNDRLTTLEVTMEKVVVPTLEKMDKFIDDNKGGIGFASLLNNKITTVVVSGIVAAALYFIGKGSL